MNFLMKTLSKNLIWDQKRTNRFQNEIRAVQANQIASIGNHNGANRTVGIIIGMTNIRGHMVKMRNGVRSKKL